MLIAGLLVFFVVLYQQNGFWLDETATWFMSWRNPLGLHQYPQVYTNHFAYYALTGALVRLGFESEFWLRLPSLLLGIHCLVLLNRLASTLLPEGNTKNRACCLFIVGALHPTFIMQLVNARPYMMLLWLSLLSLDSLVSIFSRRSMVARVVFVVSTTLAVSSHPLFVSLFLIQWSLIRILGQPIKTDRPLIYAITAVLVVTGLAWIYFGYLSFSSSRAGTAYSYLTLAAPLKTRDLLQEAWPVFVAASAWMISTARAGIFVAYQKASRLAFWATIIPIAVNVAVSLQQNLPLLILVSHYRFLSFIGETLSLLILIEGLGKRFGKPSFALLLYSLIALPVLRRPPEAEPWREAAQTINREAKHGECIAFVKPGHPEAEDSHWLPHTEMSEGWAAPLLAYRVDRNCQIATLGAVDLSTAFLDYTLAQLSPRTSQVFLVVRSRPERVEKLFIAPMHQLLVNQGFRLTEEAVQKPPRLLRYDRVPLEQ